MCVCVCVCVKETSPGVKFCSTIYSNGFPVAQLVKNPPAMPETWVRSLGWEDPLEEGTATHSSILAWRIPWTEYPWGHKESDTTERASLHFTCVLQPC